MRADRPPAPRDRSPTVWHRREAARRWVLFARLPSSRRTGPLRQRPGLLFWCSRWCSEQRWASHPSRISVHLLDIARHPGFVEEGLRRTVDAQDDKEALAGHRAQPILAVAGGIGTKIDVG